MGTNENVFPLDENRMVIETGPAENDPSLDKSAHHPDPLRNPSTENLPMNNPTHSQPTPNHTWATFYNRNNPRQSRPPSQFQNAKANSGISTATAQHGYNKMPTRPSNPAYTAHDSQRSRREKEGDFFQSAFAKHRFSKDIEELTLCRNATFLPHAKVKFHLVSRESNLCETEGVNQKSSSPKNELSRIFCDIEPCEGLYKDMQWEFELDIPSSYPFHPPIIKCLDPLFHPNINIENGQVALKILSHDWSPVLTLRAVVLSLVLLFVEPNLDCTFNDTAAGMYSADKVRFAQMVMKNIQYITSTRMNKGHRMYRRKKRDATTSSDPQFHVPQRPSQRAHLNPVLTKPSITGKRGNEEDTDAELSSMHTHHLVQKLNSCKLSGTKRRKTEGS